MNKTLDIFIDGACSGNPGIAAIGVVISKKEKVIKNISYTLKFFFLTLS